MEIPNNLKEIYRHWDNHLITQNTQNQLDNIIINKDLEKDILWFITERINIWEKKVTNKKTPYTNDIILSRYRFCNIFREFDRQTIEFHTLLNPIRNDFELWLLNMFYCRMVARTETIKDIGLLSFDIDRNKIIYQKLIKYPRPKFGTPYVFPISTILKSKTPTRELFITKYLPKITNKIASEISTWNKKSVYDGVEKILPIFGYNLKFLWTEVLIDVAYQYPEYINLFKRFTIGPGSLPTLKRINPKKDPSFLVTKLSNSELNTNLTYKNKQIQLSAENWEGIGCEFRKYTNLKSGNGRKRIFNKKI